MKLIIGLGNPGEEFTETRHNIGFLIIDNLSKRLDIKLKEKKFNGIYYFKEKKFLLLKPQTFINNSGICILKFINFFSINLKDLLIIHDDLSFPFGEFRFRMKSSNKIGHNGIKNIIKYLKKEKFKNLRIGIFNKKKKNNKDRDLKKIYHIINYNKSHIKLINNIYIIIKKHLYEILPKKKIKKKKKK